MNSKIKLFGVMILFLIGMVAISSVASAAIEILEVEIDDDVLDDTSTNEFGRDVLRGEEFKVKVHTLSEEDIDDVQVEVYIRGYGHRDRAEDITSPFDMKANVTYVKKLTLKLPSRMDQDTYELRVRIEGRSGDSAENTYVLEIDTKDHLLEIRDIVLNPENEVKAGRALLGTVRIKNRGEKEEEDIKVRMSIPALGISASDYIDELDPEDCGDDDDCDDSTTSEELYLRIPVDAETGEYTVKVEVIYDDGDEKETATTTIKIIGVEEVAPVVPSEIAKTIITVGPESQDVTRGGAGVIYPVTISNAGTTARTYTITANGADWAEFRTSPSNVVTISPGESKAVYIYLSAKDTATLGENSFAVTIKSGEITLKEVALKANVIAPTAISGWGRVKRALEIGLVILVVLLVILGLIIGFNKLKGKEEEEGKEEEKTYY